METISGKVLVTGGKGFIGKHLVTVLSDRGVKPVILDLVCGKDIRKKIEPKGFDVVFHLAALTSVPNSFDKPKEYFDTNVWGTYNVFSTFEGARLINISSSSAELMLSPYGVSKKCGEVIASRFPNSVSLRPFNVFGENQISQAVIPSFAKAILKGERPVIYGKGKQTRDFTYVKDVVEEMVWHAEHSSKGVFEIGYGQERSIRKVFGEMAMFYGFKEKPYFLPKRKGDQLHSCARDKLHVKPIGFKEGLERTLKWWQKFFKEKRH